MNNKNKLKTGLILATTMCMLVACGGESVKGDFHTLVEQDRTGNSKSVYWDGKEASLIKDELDSPMITDGRGYGMYSTIDIDEEYRFYYYDNKSDLHVKNDATDNYILESDTQKIIINSIDYDTEKAKLDTSENFKQTGKLKIKDDKLTSFDKYQTYTCIVDNYAGYSIIFKHGITGKSYQVICIGKGNIANIELQAREVINSFSVYF